MTLTVSRINAERGVLQAVLLRNDRLPAIEQMVLPEHFTDLRLRRIYEAMLQLYGKDRPIDVITLAELIPHSDLLPVIEEIWQEPVSLETYMAVVRGPDA